MAIPTYPVRHFDGSRLSIDGSLHEWPGNVYLLKLYDPRQVSGSAHHAYRGQEDISARGGLLWDESSLYLFFHIRDDWPLAMPKKRHAGGRQMPPGDSIVLRFDPRRDTRYPGPDPRRSDDREFWLARTEAGESVAVSWQSRTASQLETRARAAIRYDKRAKVYAVEASIPWKDILPGEQKPRKGMALDFQVIINDYDAPTDPLPQTRIGWTFGSGPKIHPSIYGTLLTVGGGWQGPEPPETPALPKVGSDRPSKKYWIDLLQTLYSLPLKSGARGLGGKRGELLRRLDLHLSQYPRLDFEEILTLMQRRMQRELAGYLDDGVPYLLHEAMLETLRRLEAPCQRGEPLVHALPGRGWLIRSKEGNLALSPSFPSSELMVGKLDAVFYPRCNDPLDRHDPLSFRMLYFDKPVLAHVTYHLAGVGLVSDENLAIPGSETTIANGIRARLLGERDEEGKVTATMGLQLLWPSGFCLVYPSLSSRIEQIEGKRIDILILDPDHPSAEELVRKLRPKTVILEGFLDLPRFIPGTYPRNHRLVVDGEEQALQTIQRFAATGSQVLLLAPGQAHASN
ncbi:MAG: hypothetical protein ACE5F1_00875 [Planctomycetota bacterium]